MPDLLKEIRFEPAVYSIRGPRRIGKTTVLKILAKELIDKGVEPQDVVYISCDSLSGWTELRDVLRFFAREGSRKYFLIDEASFIPEWSRAVKYVYDVGLLKRHFVLITGSHAMDVLRGIERLPGRRNKGLDLVFLPATFGEFVRTFDPKLFSAVIESQDPLYEMESKGSRIRELFDRYLYAGGFPKAQHQALSVGNVSKEFLEEFIVYLKGDALRERLDVNVLLAVARRLLETMTVPVSWRALANGTGYHHERVKEHVDFLRFAFALDYIYPPKVRKDGIVPDINRNRKIYLLDPFIVYAMYSWVYGTPSHKRIADRWLKIPELRGKLAESIVFRHLIHWVSNNIFSEEIRRDIYYVKTKKREIDFLAVKGNVGLAIEVKERKRIGYNIALAEQLFPIKIIVKILATRDDIGREKGYLKIPIPYLLLLLSVNKIESINKTNLF